MQTHATDDLQLTNLWQLRDKARTYLENKNLPKAVRLWVDMYEGNQWRDSKFTKDLQKITINFIKMSIDSKIANLFNAPFKMNFVSDTNQIVTEKVSKFVEFQNSEMNLRYHLKNYARDALVKGLGVIYFYFDEYSIGKMGLYKGALRCETLDCLRFYRADPEEDDIQKQKWVLYEDRYDIKTVRRIADKDVDKEKIVADQYETDYSDVEQNGDAKCTMLTRFFRQDGEVYFETATKFTIVQKPRPMNPRLLKVILKNETIDDPTLGSDNVLEQYEISQYHLQDDKVEGQSKTDYKKDKYKFYLYPFDTLTFTKREKCAHGISDVEGMVEAQKAVNVILSMYVKNIKDLAWGKVIEKEGALLGQKWTNEPGQKLIDYTKGANFGVKLLEGQQVSPSIMNVVSSIIELSRMVTNTNEVISGDLSKTLSGTALAQTIAQNEKPLGEYKAALYESISRIGLIEEQFYKFYYTDSPYTYTLSDVEKEQYAQKNGITDIKQVPDAVTEYFTGSEFLETPFSISVETGAGSQYSEALVVDLINTLFMNGNINQMNSDQLETFIELYPKKLMPIGDKLKEIVKKQRQSELAQAQQMNQQLQAENEQLKATVSQAEGSIKYLNGYVKALQKEFSDKINAANQQIDSMKNYMQSIPAPQQQR